MKSHSTQKDGIWGETDDGLASLCLKKLELIVPNVKKRYLGVRVLRTPYAYPVFLREYEDHRRSFQKGTGIHSLYSIGRNCEFDHLLTEDVYWRTLKKMNTILPDLAQGLRVGVAAHG